MGLNCRPDASDQEKKMDPQALGPQQEAKFEGEGRSFCSKRRRVKRMCIRCIRNTGW